jgi:predicted transcriptional regulator of viral defense system
MRNRERLLARIAASQQGAFTRAQALRCGFSETTIDRRVRSGLYERLEPTVYAASASQSSHGREVMASVLSTGGLAAAAHATAAYLWGMLSRPPKRVDVVTTRWDRVRRSAMVHESLDLQEGDVTAIDGIPVTTAARTVVDLGAMLPRMVPSALDAGLRMDLLTLDEVARFIARVAKRGRRGVGVIRPLIGRRRAGSSADPTSPTPSPRS